MYHSGAEGTRCHAGPPPAFERTSEIRAGGAPKVTRDAAHEGNRAKASTSDARASSSSFRPPRQAVHPATSAAVARQRERGKRLARERIEALLDPGQRSSSSTGTSPPQPALRDAGAPAVRRRRDHRPRHVNGRRVFVFSQDFTVFGGIAARGVRREDLQGDGPGAAVRRPVVGINDSGGARIQEGVVSLARLRRDLLAQRAGVGRDPADLARHGPVRRRRRLLAGHDRLRPDGQGTSYMFITGPDVVKTVTGEDVTSRSSAAPATHAVEVRRRALRRRRRGSLPRGRARPALVPAGEQLSSRRPGTTPPIRSDREDAELDTLIPDEPNRPYDMQHRDRAVVDDGEFLEVQRALGREHRLRLRAARRPPRRRRRRTSRARWPACSTSTRP